MLYCGFHKADVLQLESESYNSGVLDSACTSTVAGKVWFDNYVESLNDSDRDKVVKLPSRKQFKFGSGNVFHSTGEYMIPAVVAGKSVTVKTDVVHCDIPLLFSRSALKSMGARVDYENDVAVIFGKEVQLAFTSSGHHCISLVSGVQEEVNAVDLNKLDDDTRYKVILKLHRQFGHPAMVKLKGLLNDAGIWKPEYNSVLSDISEKCKICKEFASTPPRSVVCLPLARNFNEKVAMDLKHWKKGLWILYMVDLYSRYTMATFITRKLPSTVIDNVIKHWIRIFGVMGGILTDNGGEFSADEVRDVASVLDIKVHTTGAESPNQNGMCERVHAVTDMILHKLEAEYPNTSLEVLLAWACMAKNCLQMFNGFSANQLVFGRNPNLPNVLTDNVAALDGVTESEVFASHLNILHAARRAFIQSESEERIRRALRHKVRVNEKTFNIGDSVFYKRDNQTRWLGPGKVLGQDGKVIFVRHGGSLVRVSSNRLIDANNVQFGDLTDDSGRLVDSISSTVEFKQKPVSNGVEILDKDDQSTVGDLVDDTVQRIPAQENVDEDILGGNITLTDNVPVVPAAVANKRQSDSIYDRRSLRAFNKEHGASVYIVNLPRGRHNDPDCINAKQVELDKLRDFGVYEEVRNQGQQCISTRWVLWEKGEKKEVRARLVARGFEEEVDVPVDSPTVSKCTVRMVLAIAVAKQWVVKAIDIKSAFLQGQALQRDVYLKPPKEANVDKDMIWKLNRCLYGLNDAARKFYDSIDQELRKLGCKRSHLDPSLFTLSDSSGCQGLLASHIDDFLHVGGATFETKVTSKLVERFVAGKNLSTEFKYTGYQVTQYSDHIVLDQNDYLDGVSPAVFSAERAMQTSSELTAEEATKYRSIIGSLNWVWQGTRPDLAFELVQLSTKFKSCTVSDLKDVNKLLRKARANKCEVVFGDLGTVECWRIITYVDASFANLCNGTASCIGYLVFLVGKNNNCCALVWRSGKARRVCKSTESAEMMALLEGIEESIYVKTLITNTLSLSKTMLPIICMTDHKGLMDCIHSTHLTEDRRLRIDVANVKECLQKADISEIRKVSSAQQLADCLTKKGADGRKLLSVLQKGRLNLDF